MTADRFASLPELQTRHAELVREVGRDVLHTNVPDRVAEFVARAVGTGAVLEAKDDRAAAQGLIGYWTARLTTASREADRSASAGGGPAVANPFDAIDTLLEDFDPGTLTAAVAAADEWRAGLNDEDAALMRWVLVRLVRVQEDGVVAPIPVTRLSLHDLDDTGTRLAGLLDRLQALGVVRLSVRPNGVEEVSLRSDTFVERWAYLKGLIAQRVELRRLAAVWNETRAQAAARPGGFWRWVRRQLVSIGKRIDAGSEGVIRLFGGRRHFASDPTADLPDVDFYRDRTPAEIGYLFHRRALAKEGQEWFRVVKGLVLMGVLVAVVVLLKRQADLNEFRRQREDAKTQQEKKVAQVKVEASRNEIVKRQARQRLKEHIVLVRLLAQHRQFDNPRDYPRAEVAKWRIEAPVVGSPEDLKDLQEDWHKIGVQTKPHPSSPGDAVCAECSQEPLAVAKLLREKLLEPRLNPGGDQYDPDTLAYRNALIREWYEAADKLANAIGDVFDPPSDGPPHTLIGAAGYMDEFWVLYFGEMVIVESSDVADAMVDFGEALKDVDKVFADEMDRRLEGMGAKKAGKKPEWNVVTNSYLWTSADKPDELATKRGDFLQRRIVNLKSAFTDKQKKVVADAIQTVRNRQADLHTVLRRELEQLPNTVPPPSVEKK